MKRKGGSWEPWPLKRGAVIAVEFVEVKTGLENDRPQLAAVKPKGDPLCGYRKGAA